MVIDQLPPLREVINTHGLTAKKSLGQNFLLDMNVTSKIARSAGKLEGENILEIGPGPGGLTRAILAENPKKMIAIERDERCLSALEEIKSIYPNNFEIINADALSIDPTSYFDGPVKIIANLPYNIGTELLTRWLSPANWPPYWSSMTLMFQKEVADRITAKPGIKAYGRLSILSQWRSTAKQIYQLPPSVFTPPPKVNSTVVHIRPNMDAPTDIDLKKLENLTRKAFGQRRKMLRSSLKGITGDLENKLISIGLKPTDRAETVSVSTFCELSKLI